ncbi:MAG TPA: type II secretion system F family protein, partial [Candidatus Hydrogenedentes bacterium]|nr:type II secretion system F family protein [Candidatus Hydrogenedentota bacterium]
YNAELLALSLLGALTALIAFLVLRLFFRSGAREAVLLSLRDDLLAGIQLSEALSRRPRFFPAFYADMVRAGEESGRLLECLEQLGEDTLDAVTFRGKVRQQLGYLCTVLAIQSLIMTFMFLKIVPVFDEIFRDFGTEPTGLMQWVIFAADFIYYHWYGVPLIFALLVVYCIKCLVRPRRAFAAKPAAGLLMLVPGLRTFIVRQNAAVVSLMLEKLLRAGAPLPAALDSAARADIRPAYRRMLERIRGRVSQGEGLAAACVPEAWLLPASFRTLVAVGERSDMLPDALGTLAAQYRECTERWARFLVDMITPVGVVALGGLTLAFEAAIFTTLASLVDVLVP